LQTLASNTNPSEHFEAQDLFSIFQYNPSTQVTQDESELQVAQVLSQTWQVPSFR